MIFDYAVERTFFSSLAHFAQDALASRVLSAGGIQHLIEPQAVAAMLRGFGFRQIFDLAEKELPVGSGHLVSAVV